MNDFSNYVVMNQKSELPDEAENRANILPVEFALESDRPNPDSGHDTQIQRAESRTEKAKIRTEQAETRTEQAEARTEQAKTRTEQAETRTEQAKSRTDQAVARTEQAETRTEQAMARMEKAEMRLEESEAHAEQSVRASELSYRRLFEAARDGILILNVDTGRITDVNPFLVELLGFSFNEMVGKTVGELSPFKDIESNKVMLQRLQKDGYVRYENLPLETRDGRHIAVEFVSNVYHAGDKKVIQCNVRDNTERQRAQMALKQLAVIVEFSDDAILGTELDGNITSWNKGAEKLFGGDAKERVGTSIMRLIPADREAEESQIIAKLHKGDHVEQFETVRQTNDGRLVDVSLTASAIHNAAGEMVSISKVARDISERKRAEAAIYHLNTQLEQRVLERTAQLQTANEELAAFSYSVSHDLRAPLRHIMGFVDLLQKDVAQSLSEKNSRYLTIISKSAKQMGTLIDDLLTFSHVGQAGMHIEAISLDELVQETLGDFQLEIKDRKILWEIPPLPTVIADRALLRMVLVNLISNAVKFTNQRAEAKIEFGCVPGKKDETVIFIRDNGAGFDPRYADKLFGVFQRLHSKEEFEGTGIGLANIQRIIRRHGGRTWAEGTVDGGATLYFSIPKIHGGTNEQ
jgi:PAS domain S-box-containing protein